MCLRYRLLVYPLYIPYITQHTYIILYNITRFSHNHAYYTHCITHTQRGVGGERSSPFCRIMLSSRNSFAILFLEKSLALYFTRGVYQETMMGGGFGIYDPPHTGLYYGTVCIFLTQDYCISLYHMVK